MNSKKLSRRVFYALQGVAEKIKGVDFISDVESRNENHVEYVASTPLVHGILSTYFKAMGVGEEDAIMDVGCGKGRMLTYFSSIPFVKIGGVEYEEYLLQICRNNLRKLKIYRVALFHADASKFEGYGDYNYFYIFNPFHESVMQGFIDKLKQSKEDNPREIRVLYFNPMDKAMFINSGFELEKILQHDIAVLRL